jgi:tripartite-type tricarboxylate transporter receptor subunit TctC
MADAYNRRTGNNLIVESVGGGNQIPGVVRFKNMSKPGLMLTTTSILVFNPKLVKDIPYSDSDFVPISPVAMSPIVWVVRSDSPYKNMSDLVKILPYNAKNFVAFANPVELANLKLIEQKYKWPTRTVESIKYKGVPEVVSAMLSNDIDVSVISHTPVIEELVKAGKLRILGSTADQPITVAGKPVLPVYTQIGVKQFSGGVFIVSSPKMDPAEAKQLHADIIDTIKDREVQLNLAARNQISIGHGSKVYQQFIDNFRLNINQLDL